MYLTGPEIERQVAEGRIVIDPLDPECVGPNSIDLHLHPDLMVYRGTQDYPDVNPVLDMRRTDDLVTHRMTIPDTGMILTPGKLYLGRTVEHTEFPDHMAQITGRSSVGRLGLSIHITAGLGDIGFRGTWTLEITVVHPVRVYPNVRICQLYVAQVVGERRPYRGRYQNQRDATASRFHER